MQTVQKDGVTIRNGVSSASRALHKQGGGFWSPGRQLDVAILKRTIPSP
jgi:hypothetical protein